MPAMNKVQVGNRNSKMDASGRRSRGRPENTKKVPADLHQDIWVAVEVQRWRMRDDSGRLGNISQACRALARRAGVNFIIGGDTRAISRAVKRKGSSKLLRELRRVDFKKERGRFRLVNAPEGWIFLQHSIQEYMSLRARYNEAARMVRNNYELKKFWSSIVWQRLGLPQRPRDA
jgi:hypothetical protein